MSVATRTALKNTIESQGSWREEKAIEYPDDPRNIMAAEALDSLAGFVQTLDESDPLLRRLEPLRSDDVLFLGVLASQKLSRYGFVTDAEPRDFLGKFADAALLEQAGFLAEIGEPLQPRGPGGLMAAPW